ncbi:MAG TPA: 1-acyl-sn-glycerol-3-phosphate acyltransferase, partial [Candidatus Lustribacter sp.]|nr:1-acyl-sn-glycerol-3-phosphate acyltransferase [Candidatus Lustribacter sp.]
MLFGAGYRCRTLGTARSVLRAGGVAGVFPEGTRGRGDVAQVSQGATWLAPHSGAQIVPVEVQLGRVDEDHTVGGLGELRDGGVAPVPADDLLAGGGKAGGVGCAVQLTGAPREPRGLARGEEH